MDPLQFHDYSRQIIALHKGGKFNWDQIVNSGWNGLTPTQVRALQIRLIDLAVIRKEINAGNTTIVLDPDFPSEKYTAPPQKIKAEQIQEESEEQQEILPKSNKERNVAILIFIVALVITIIVLLVVKRR